MMKEAVETGTTEEERKIDNENNGNNSQIPMKSHKLLYRLKNKLTWLQLLVLAACEQQYHLSLLTPPSPLTDGIKVNTLVYTLPNYYPYRKSTKQINR